MSPATLCIFEMSWPTDHRLVENEQDESRCDSNTKNKKHEKLQLLGRVVAVDSIFFSILDENFLM